MGNFPHLVAGLVFMLMLTLAPRAGYAAEVRFALVIGNDEYKAAKLATPANDAGLVADAGGGIYRHRRAQPRSGDAA